MAFGFTMKISRSAYQKALARVQKANRAWKRRERRRPGRRPSYKITRPMKSYVTNRDRSVVEVYRFQQRKSAKPFVAYLKGRKVTNWTGLRLCDVTSRKEGRRGFHGSKIVTVQAKCIDGRTYVGTGPGDQMYLRLRPKKGR